ncbi:hypothetical protein BYT27DRAFT_7250189 [Phlegmacium glaucopus]|nr:hypothetical protein BYT27DRAFT_7250189 [Phlegmacium glaucopus]
MAPNSPNCSRHNCCDHSHPIGNRELQAALHVVLGSNRMATLTKPPKLAPNVDYGIPGAQRNGIGKPGPSTWKESTRTAPAPRVVFQWFGLVPEEWLNMGLGILPE